MTPELRAALFADAADRTDRDAFVAAHSHTADPDKLKHFWRTAHYSVGEICQFAAVSLSELSQRSLVPYSTLQRWAYDDEKFTVRNRYYLLILTGLLPDL